jgi:hypothetical protein
MTQHTLPEGFESRSSDIVGTWDTESGPIRFIPTHAIVADGKKFDKTKPSCLIFGKLTVDTVLLAKGDEDDEKEKIQGKAGDNVGVWAKPGMKDIANLCGVEVFMVRTPEKDKDVGKGNDMKTYLVASKSNPNKPIPITVDRRDLSKGNRCILDPADYGKASKKETPGPVPF